MLILIASLVGCADYTTVEDACPDDVPITGTVDDAFALDFAGRGACYRTIVGLSPPALHADVQLGVEKHVAYLEANGLPLDDAGYLVGDWQSESEDTAYFGATVFDRLDTAGYDYQLASLGVWEMFAPIAADGSAESTVDALMTYAEFHEVILQHGWSAAGFAQGADPVFGPYVYGVILYGFPAIDNKSWVTWPTDGQLDAPISGAEGLLGPAFSIVVGGNTDAAAFNSEDPYELEFVRTPTLAGPDGTIALSWTKPGDDVLDLPRYSAIGYAKDRLTPDTEYTLKGEIAYTGGTQAIDVKFTTGLVGGQAPAARTLPVHVRHHTPRTPLTGAPR